MGRRAVLGGLGAGALALAGCSLGSSSTVPEAESPRDAVRVRTDGVATTLPADDTTGVAAVHALLTRATTVVVTGPTASDLGRGLAAARDLGIPLLSTGPDLGAELSRLGTRTVVGYGATGLPAGLTVVRPEGTDTPDVDGLPRRPGHRGAVALVRRGTSLPPQVAATVAAAGGRVVTVDGDDVRASADAIAAVRAAPRAPVVALGFDVDDHHLTTRVGMMRTAAQLPGGGLLVFPAHHVIALYGHPGTASLGLLGEQSAAASVTRVKKLADQYAALLDRPVLPAFEIIATVASGSRLDGSYSSKTPVATIAPWIDAAEQAGIYTVLDLQPGRDTFLSQAKRYEELLARPWVGLALDPEWRLGPTQRPLQQIGSVDVDEINETSQWLADLVDHHRLPPKILTLHQFRTAMIHDRADLVTDHDELQIVVHVDGQGSQPDKQGTWKAIRQDLPKDVFLGWKNFVDEDHPMLTPEQTVRVSPLPDLVTYQ